MRISLTTLIVLILMAQTGFARELSIQQFVKLEQNALKNYTEGRYPAAFEGFNTLARAGSKTGQHKARGKK